MKTKSLILIVFLLLLFFSTTVLSVETETNGDNTVYYEDEDILIVTSNVTRNNGYIYPEITYKNLPGDAANVDLAFGVDEEELKFVNGEYYSPHFAEWNITHDQWFYNVSINGTYTNQILDYGTENNSMKYIIDHDITNGTKTERITSNISFDSIYPLPFVEGGDYRIVWDTEHSGIKDWKLIPNDRLSIIYYTHDEKTKWYVLKDISATVNETIRLRAKVRTPHRIGSYSYKYDVATKLSSDTFSEAITNDRFKLVDPYGDSSNFNSTWDTSKVGVSNDTAITLPLEVGGTYDFTVWWGDGSDDYITVYNQANVTHNYPSTDEYDVVISGTISGFRFNNGGDKLKLLNISNWGDLNVGNSGNYFHGCSNFNSTADDTLDLTDTLSMTSMFHYADVFNGNISGWNTLEVTTMANMFAYTDVFNGNISSWNTLEVTDMSYMFYSADVFNGNISGWNTSKVTGMNNMFMSAIVFNSNISSWNTSKVANMDYMFYSADAFNQSLNTWNTSKVTSMSSMFYSTNVFNGNISLWNTSKVTNMANMFKSATLFNSNISNWNVAKVTDMDEMFENSAIDQDFGDWNVSACIDFVEMFNGVTLSTANYDSLLIGWAALPSLSSDESFHGGNSQYNEGTAANARNDTLIGVWNWAITDGGMIAGAGDVYYANVSDTISVLDNISINKTEAPLTVTPDNYAVAGHYDADLLSENAYSTGFVPADIDFYTEMTSTQYTALSTNDDSFVVSGGDNQDDGYLYVNFSVPNVSSINSMDITVVGTGDENWYMGAYNYTENKWETMDSTTSTSEVTMNYLIEGDEVSHYSQLTDDNATFSIALWESDGAAGIVNGDLISIVFNYIEVSEGPYYYNVYADDTITITDSVFLNKTAVPLNYYTNVFDTITISDSVSLDRTVASISYYTNVTDTISISDSIDITKITAYVINPNMTITLSDSVNLTKTVASVNYYTNVSDTITITDSVYLNKTASLVNYYINVSDTITIVDSISLNKTVTSVSYYTNVSDTITISDNVDITKIVTGVTYYANTSDSITISDSVNLAKTVASVNYYINATETITYLDSVFLNKTTSIINYYTNVSDTITVFDLVDLNKTTASINYYINVSDSITITDSVNMTKSVQGIVYYTNVSDTISITDDVQLNKTTVGVMNYIYPNDSITVADSVFINKTVTSVNYNIYPIDTITITDSVYLNKTVAPVSYYVYPNDTITFTDSIGITKTAATVTYNVNELDSITISDSISITKSTFAEAQITITKISFTPSPLFTNYTGATTISYMVNSTHPLNLSSLAFLYGLNYTITSDMHNYIASPPNDIASEGLYRAPNRNASPYLSWEFNDTITEGNVWQWGGGDNNSWWISKTPINATHTYVNVTGITQHILPSSFYIKKTAMYDAPKTGFEINRQQGLIFKMWNVEEIRNRNDNYFANMYFDTNWESTLPTHPVEVGFCNFSYDPTVDDIDTSTDCTKFGEWDGNRWVNHSWMPGPNASYAYPFVVNASQFTEPIPTDINYIWLRSNTISSKSYVLNATNHDPGITNITFAETNTMWTYNELNGVTTPVAYTPSFFTTFARDYEELLHHLYIADDTGVWGHSDIFNETIGLSSVPVQSVSFEHFNVTCQGNYINDTLMDATYDEGNIFVNIHCPADPDGGIVSHNLTLHYATNQTLVAIVNNTFTTTSDEYVDINFITSSYYSSSNFYTLRCVSTDDENDVATKWLISNFTLDADGNQGWVVDDRVLFWGMNDIPTLYATVANDSLISYNAGSNIYTMHVPFFKSKSNDTFYFNETVHLESLDNEDVAYFRHSGSTIFDYAIINAWNTATDTAAPITDEYRSYVYSHFHVCGNITNSDFSHLGSDFYRQEGLNFIDNPHEYLIFNTTFSHNAEGPIMEYCSNMNISECTITDNVNVGIGIYFTNDTTVNNNIISSNGGRGISIYEGYNNIINYNTITNSGAHGIHLWSNSGNNTATANDITGSAQYDYYLSSSSLGNYIIDPASTTDRIRVTSTSSINIENTDNAAFTEDSLNTSYAYLTNFSMFVSGASQTFDITQRDMTILPSNDNLSIENFEWGNTIQFNVNSSIGVTQTWFNITNARWKNEQISIFRDGSPYNVSYADENGTLDYNYSVSIGDNFFEFVLTIPPSPVPVSVYSFMGVLLFVFCGASFMLTGISSIFTSVISIMFSFIMSKIAVNGSLVQNIGGVSSTGTVVQGVTRIEFPALSYILIFVGLFMIVILAVQVMREIKFRESRDVIELDL